MNQVEEKKVENKFLWYSLKVISGKELVAKDNILFESETGDVSDLIDDILVPSEGVGWEMEATAIMKGTKNLEAAKTLADWTITVKAMEMYNTAYAVVGIPGVAKPVEHFPEGLLEAMIVNDFEWAAQNRKRLLAEWQKRYDSKSEPKS